MSNTSNKPRTPEVDGGTGASAGAAGVPAPPPSAAQAPEANHAGAGEARPVATAARAQSAPPTPARIPGYSAPRPVARHGFRVCTVVGVPVSSGGRTYPVGHEGEFALTDIESLPHWLVPVG